MDILQIELSASYLGFEPYFIELNFRIELEGRYGKLLTKFSTSFNGARSQSALLIEHATGGSNLLILSMD